MAGATDYTASNILNYITGQITVPALPSVWIGLFTTAPTSDLATTGATEVSGGSYARVQAAGQLAASSASTTIITFGAVPAWVQPGMSVRDVTTPANVPAATTVSSVTATTVTCNNTVSGVGTDTIRFSAFTPPVASSGAEPATVAELVQNGSIVTFPQATASWGTAVAFGLFDAATSVNCLAWDWLGNFKWIPFSCTNASPGVLTVVAHGYTNGDPVVVSAKYGGVLPTTAGSWSGALTVASTTTDTFTAGVNTTSTGDGLVRKILQQPIAINVTASFAAATLVISNA